MPGCMSGWTLILPVHFLAAVLASGGVFGMSGLVAFHRTNCSGRLSAWTGVAVRQRLPIYVCPIPREHRRGRSGSWVSSISRPALPAAKAIGPVATTCLTLSKRWRLLSGKAVGACDQKPRRWWLMTRCSTQQAVIGDLLRGTSKLRVVRCCGREK